MNLKEEIKEFFKGEVFDDEETLTLYSKDASLFKVRPKLVVFPQERGDLENLVQFVNDHKASDPTLSITMRAAGSDMSGGPLNGSIIADVTKHLNKMGEIRTDGGLSLVSAEPGVFYRDFEKATLGHKLLLPCYPASKDMAALGGMIGNNCGGELTLRYGKMEDYIQSAKYIFADGREYAVKPLDKAELAAKMAQGDFEGNLYKEIHQLIEANRGEIEAAKPRVTKNSAGYFLWNVYPEPVEGSERIFDLNRLLVGAQGTLGALTEATVRLVPAKEHHDMIALFFKSWDELPAVVNAILPHQPESLETFDDETLKLGIRFMPEVAKKAHSGFLAFAAKFLPEAFIGVRMLGLPKLIILVEVAEASEEEVKAKISKIMSAIEPFKVWHRVIEKDSEEEKFWVMRRESFSLLRKHVGDKRTVPLVDDFCIPPEKVPEFLPLAREVLAKHGIKANIAGHAGDGNFHIIPLMNLKDESEREKLIPVADAFYDLVARFKGTTTGEHNDGIVRTPFLSKMYNPAMLELFKKTKEIFDPQNIFNPGKKVGATLNDFEKYLDQG